MDRFWLLTHYLQEHPVSGVVVIVLAAYGLYRLLNRKSRLAREADERFEQLRKDRGSHYDRTRPLR